MTKFLAPIKPLKKRSQSITRDRKMQLKLSFQDLKMQQWVHT